MSRVWNATYVHDRRKHHHRCIACNRIMRAGEEAVWCRLPTNGRTKVMHATHADEPVSPDAHDPRYPHIGVWTWLHSFKAWAEEKI